MRITTNGTLSSTDSYYNYFRQFGGVPSRETGTKHVATIDIVFRSNSATVQVNSEPLFDFTITRSG